MRLINTLYQSSQRYLQSFLFLTKKIHNGKCKPSLLRQKRLRLLTWHQQQSVQVRPKTADVAEKIETYDVHFTEL